MVTINEVNYQNPYIVIATKERAQLCLDAVTYRMGFEAGKSTERLVEDLLETTDGKYAFPHPAGTGFEDWQRTLSGITSYTVVEFDPLWIHVEE